MFIKCIIGTASGSSKVAIVENFRQFVTFVSSEQFTELKSDLSLGAKFGHRLPLLNNIFKALFRDLRIFVAYGLMARWP